MARAENIIQFKGEDLVAAIARQVEASSKKMFDEVKKSSDAERAAAKAATEAKKSEILARRDLERKAHEGARIAREAARLDEHKASVAMRAEMAKQRREQAKAAHEQAEIAKYGQGQIARGMRQVNTSVRGITQSWQMWSMGISSAIGMLGQVVALGRAIQEAIREGAQAIDLKAIYEINAGGAEQAAESIAALRAATKGTVDDLTLYKNANLLTTMGADAEQAAQMFNIAYRASIATGQDVTYMLESVTTAIARGSALRLDNLGIVVDVTQAEEEYASNLGRSRESLSKSEQMTAMLTAAMHEADRAFAATEHMDSRVEAIKRVDATFANFNSGFKESLAESAHLMRKVMADLYDDITNIRKASMDAVLWIGRLFPESAIGKSLQIRAMTSDMLAAKAEAAGQNVTPDEMFGGGADNAWGEAAPLPTPWEQKNEWYAGGGKKGGGGRKKGGGWREKIGRDWDKEQAKTLKDAERNAKRATQWGAREAEKLRTALREVASDAWSKKMLGGLAKVVDRNADAWRKMSDDAEEARQKDLERITSYTSLAADKLSRFGIISSQNARVVADSMAMAWEASGPEAAGQAVKGMAYLTTGIGEQFVKWAGWQVLRETSEGFAALATPGMQWAAALHFVSAATAGVLAAVDASSGSSSGGRVAGGRGAVNAGNSAPRVEQPRREGPSKKEGSINVFVYGNTVIGGRHATEGEVGWMLGQYAAAARYEGLL